MSAIAASDLVIQHPLLAHDAVAAISARLGAEPATRQATLARWPGARIDTAAVAALAAAHRVDAALVPAHRLLSHFRLIALDMDSTLINIECVDEIADFAGRKAEVAALTEAAMRGEIADYDESLRQRVALLAGLDAAVLERVWSERLSLATGARKLVAGMRAAGLQTLLVSGGFTFFTARLQAQLGLDQAHANTLEIVDGRLTGRLVGAIVNAQDKQRALAQACARLGCTPAQAIAVGDGANDLAMMAVAGLSVAYRAKPQVAAQASHTIVHCGLDAILNLFAPGS